MRTSTTIKPLRRQAQELQKGAGAEKNHGQFMKRIEPERMRAIS